MNKARRAWLKLIAGVTTLSSQLGCGDQQANSVPPRGAQRLDDMSLRALVDTIVPADQDPGAVDVGIHLQLMEKISKDPAQYSLYVKGLAMFDAEAQLRHRRRFADLDLDAREKLLIAMVRGMKKEYADGRRCIIYARHAVLTAFYSSPAGWRVLGYRPPRDGYV